MVSTADYFGVSLEDLRGHSRSRVLVNARQVAMYLSRELTGATLPTIGRAFGNRNHTTVMHACKRTTARIDEDAATRETIQRLIRELSGAR